MKYKVLLMGKKSVMLDDFFTHMDEQFEAQSTSVRYPDILCHLKYFRPDLVVFCIYQESRNVIVRMQSLKARLQRNHIPFVIIGDSDDCEAFMSLAGNMVDLVIEKPASVKLIQEKLVHFIKEWKEDIEDDGQRDVIDEIRKELVEDNIEQAESGEEDMAPPQKKHILVVDDDPMMLKLLKEHLHMDYDVATALSGRIALKFLEKKSTDLVLLDYEMPQEDGTTVLQTIRNRKELEGLPVVFLTGVKEKDKIQRALSLKPQGYLLKPIDRDKLFEVVKELLG